MINGSYLTLALFDRQPPNLSAGIHAICIDLAALVLKSKIWWFSAVVPQMLAGVFIAQNGKWQTVEIT